MIHLLPFVFDIFLSRATQNYLRGLIQHEGCMLDKPNLNGGEDNIGILYTNNQPPILEKPGYATYCTHS